MKNRRSLQIFSYGRHLIFLSPTWKQSSSTVFFFKSIKLPDSSQLFENAVFRLKKKIVEFLLSQKASTAASFPSSCTVIKGMVLWQDVERGSRWPRFRIILCHAWDQSLSYSSIYFTASFGGVELNERPFCILCWAPEGMAEYHFSTI